jgi:hypothetical protein
MSRKPNKVETKKEIAKEITGDETTLLKSKLVEMEEMLKALMKKNEELENKPEKVVEVIKEVRVTSESNPEIIDIPLNKVIKVMSLYTGTLNLKTAENGKIFKFNNFGEIHPIIYNDLIQIMSHQHRFCTEGYFTILDKDVILAHGMEDNYKKILDRKTIENFLGFDDETIKTLYHGTTKNIRDSIVSIIVNKINSEENVDKNKIYVVSDLFGIDLFAYARGDVDVLVNSKISR